MDLMTVEDKPYNPLGVLNSFSLNGSSEQMKKQMLDDVFVLGRVALLGQATVLYAEPNTGKTLLTVWMLIEQIKKGDLKSSDVYYINADDNYRGLVQKLAYAEKYDFHMLAPSHKGMTVGTVAGLMHDLAKHDQASGKVFILDTLKKFADIMDKASQREFNLTMREFTSKGGTVIMLAHTNKNRSGDGELVHAGTSDMKDDSDCVYIIESISEVHGRRTIKFMNDKARGDVAKECSFSYSTTEGNSYDDVLNSIKEESKDSLESIMAVEKVKELEIKFNDELIFIVEQLRVKPQTASSLESMRKESEQLFGRPRLNDCLKAFNGTRWISKPSPTHSTAIEFHLKMTPIP